MESGLAPAHDLALNLVLTLSHNWWVLLLRGCAAILFGGLAFATPGRSLESLVLLFGAFCLADGVMAAWTSIWHRRQAENGWLLLIGGLLGIGVGLMTIFQPAVTALGLLLWRTSLRSAVPAGLLAGSLATLAIAVLAVPVILLGFDGFFVRFHEIFFSGDSWQFSSADTLIRIYPEQFWIDVSRITAGLAVLQAIVLAGLAWWWLRSARRRAA